MRLHGIHPALVTPFHEDGTVDLPSLTGLIEHLIDAGVHGVVACGTTGETPTLTPEEWESVIAHTVKVVAGRVPVTAGIGTNATPSSVHNAKRAQALGADAGLLVFPYYNKPNPKGHHAHVDAVLEADLPIVLYHVPGRTGQRLGAQQVADLMSKPGVVGIKEATGDLIFGGDLLHRTEKTVLSGDDFTFLPLLSMGGTGCISVVANVAPKTTVAVYNHFQAGENSEARKAMHALLPLVNLLFSDSNPVPCKAILAAQGRMTSTVRLPLMPHDGPLPAELVALP